MSAANGSARFREFHVEVSTASHAAPKGELLPFAPDFLDSLVCRMTTGDLTEATLAWTIFRQWGNYNAERAVHLYAGSRPKFRGVANKNPNFRGVANISEETPLRQVDCALDLAWLQAGYHPAWLDAPRDLFREEAARRQVAPMPRTLICEAFTENRERKAIAKDTGHDLCAVASPRLEILHYSPENPGSPPDPEEPEEPAKGLYQEFLEEWNVGHSPEIQEEAVARSVIKRINKVRLSDYKVWRKLRTERTNGTPSLESLETKRNGSSTQTVAVVAESTDYDVPAPAIPTPEPDPVPVPANPEPCVAVEVFIPTKGIEPPQPRREPCPHCLTLHTPADTKAIIDEFAVPTLGTTPTLEQHLEIYRRMRDGCPAQLKILILNAIARGKLTSVIMLLFLADDCARGKGIWKPPPASGKLANEARRWKQEIDDGVQMMQALRAMRRGG